jgi:FkbM family methyltransferase
MLINCNIIKTILEYYNINIRGIIHIGAHECEEKEAYNTVFNIMDNNIIWIDGNNEKVEENKRKGIENVYCAILDEDNKDVEFHITNNTQASGILTLNHEDGYYREIVVNKTIKSKSEKLSTFIKRIDRDASNYNFWNLDIQGSELFVLRGSKELLDNCDVIYTEVNSQQVYNNCGLVNQIDELLSEYGFKRVHTIWTEKNWGDALYVKIRN